MAVRRSSSRVARANRFASSPLASRHYEVEALEYRMLLASVIGATGAGASLYRGLGDGRFDAVAAKAHSGSLNVWPSAVGATVAPMAAAPDATTFAENVTAPLAPKPGHTFYVSGLNSQGGAVQQWTNASAITPNTTNDLVLNATPLSTNYVACCEAAGGSLGASLLTNGITQTQAAPGPGIGQPALGDGSANDASNNANVVSSAAGPFPFFVYGLGTAGGAAASPTGYDLSEVDVIAGHQDQNGEIFSIDVLVQPVGSSQFLSLSGGRGYSFTTAPNGQGGSVYVSRGSSQLAIVGSAPGQPFARNIQSVELLVRDSTTFLREFVVTGVTSASLSAAPTAPSAVAADTAGPGSVVTWAASAGAVGYTVQRSLSPAGPFSGVGSVVGVTTFNDATAQPNSTYYYRVVASGNGDSGPSVTTSAAVTGSFGATAYLYPNQLWSGTPSIVENFQQIDFRGGPQNSSFPLAQGFPTGSFSAFITGKIRTDLAGAYTFFANTDDDGYLWVNGQLVSGNPGGHVQQAPVITNPVSLAANTAYDFVFLENQRGGQWGFGMSWQEPTANGSAGPLTLVPASHLSPTVGAPPVPSQPAVTVTSTNTIAVSWNNAGDTSSYGYVVERAWSDSNGNPTTAFSVIGQVFSGPTTLGAPGAATWGASSFVDTTALANTSYVYKVGVIMPGQASPAALSSASSPVALPPVDTVALSNGIMSITAGDANDGIGIYLDSGQIVVTEGATTGSISAITIFSTPASAVNSLFVTGISSGYQSLNLTRALSFPGTVTATQLSEIWVYGALSASQVSFVASGDIGIYASVTTTGPVTLQADSNSDGAGTLSVASTATISSGGSPVSVHSAGLALDGTINAGGGNVTYSLWPLTSVSGLFSNTVSSGTVTVAQTTSSAVTLSGVFGPGVSGKVILDFSNAAFSTSGLDTSGGNAALQIVASSILTAGPLNTGSGTLTVSAGNVTFGAAVNAGSLSIPPYAHVTVDGATVSVAGGIANAGSLLVGTGGIVTAGGALSGAGSVTTGFPSGSGTVAYYRFEGTPGTAATGAATITDASGNGLSGTPVGSPVFGPSIPATPVPMTGQTNTSSMSFNGTDQRVFIPDGPSFQLTKSLTLEAWVYALPLASGNLVGEIIFRGDARSGYDPYFLEFGRRGPNVAGFTISDAANNMAEVDAAIPLNQWTHLAGTLDDATGQLRLYVNGTLASSKTTTVRPFGGLTSASPGLGIGGLENGGEYFNGLIDEVRISNVALTPSQFLDAPPRANTASLTVGSVGQSAVSVNPGGVVTVRHSTSPSTSATNSLNIAPGGKFDLSNNVLFVNYAGQSDPATTIRTYLAAGYNGGTWNGSGITSSDAAGNPLAYALGYADSADGMVIGQPANTIGIRYTALGDANLDGVVDANDAIILARHYPSASPAWDLGDFNYDGMIGLTDATVLQANYGKTAVTGSLNLNGPAASISPTSSTAPQTTAPSVPVSGRESGTTGTAVSSNRGSCLGPDQK